MNADNPATSPDSEEDPDDPYIHIVPTEEFVETVEQVSQEENGYVLAPIRDLETSFW